MAGSYKGILCYFLSEGNLCSLSFKDLLFIFYSRFPFSFYYMLCFDPFSQPTLLSLCFLLFLRSPLLRSLLDPLLLHNIYFRPEIVFTASYFFMNDSIPLILFQAITYPFIFFHEFCFCVVIPQVRECIKMCILNLNRNSSVEGMESSGALLRKFKEWTVQVSSFQ